MAQQALRQPCPSSPHFPWEFQELMCTQGPSWSTGSRTLSPSTPMTCWEAPVLSSAPLSCSLSQWLTEQERGKHCSALDGQHNCTAQCPSLCCSSTQVPCAGLPGSPPAAVPATGRAGDPAFSSWPEQQTLSPGPFAGHSLVRCDFSA